jgi:hypothetical protein
LPRQNYMTAALRLCRKLRSKLVKETAVMNGHQHYYYVLTEMHSVGFEVVNRVTTRE